MLRLASYLSPASVLVALLLCIVVCNILIRFRNIKQTTKTEGASHKVEASLSIHASPQFAIDNPDRPVFLLSRQNSHDTHTPGGSESLNFPSSTNAIVREAGAIGGDTVPGAIPLNTAPAPPARCLSAESLLDSAPLPQLPHTQSATAHLGVEDEVGRGSWASERHAIATGIIVLDEVNHSGTDHHSQGPGHTARGQAITSCTAEPCSAVLDIMTCGSKPVSTNLMSLSSMRQAAGTLTMPDMSTSKDILLYKAIMSDRFLSKDAPMSDGLIRSATDPTAAVTSQKLLKSICTTPYSSKLGRKVKMCVKTRTGVGVDELPADLGQNLQTALRGIGLSSPYTLMDMAVREGCLLLSLDLVQQLASGTDSSHVHDIPSDHMSSVVHALLPTIEPLLVQQQRLKGGVGEHSSPADVFEHGQCYLTLQVDDGMLRVVWDEQLQTWVVEQEEAAEPSTGASSDAPDRGTWQLGPALQVACVDSGTDHADVSVKCGSSSGRSSDSSVVTAAILMSTPCQVSSGKLASSSSGSTIKAAPSVAGSAGKPEGSSSISTAPVVACMHLHVWCAHRHVDDPFGKLTTPDDRTSALRVQGWSRPPPGYHADHVWKPGSQNKASADVQQYQVLIKCQGQYVQTSASCVNIPGQALINTWLLQVDVDMSELVGLQLHHHQGGLALPILPVVVELWQDHAHRCLAAAPLLLNMPTPSPTSPPVSGIFGHVKVPVWLGGFPQVDACWWGTRGDTAMRSMQEISQLSEALCCMQMHAAATQHGSSGSSMATPVVWTAAELVIGAESHHEFTTDLIVWLNSVHQLAVHSGQCMYGGVCNRLPGTDLDGAVLQIEDLADLGLALIQHAQLVGAVGVVAMVTQQYQSVVQPALKAKPLCHTSSGHASHAHSTAPATAMAPGQLGQLLASVQQTWAAMRLSAVGSECEMCEVQYKTRLSKQLHGVQVLSSGAYATNARCSWLGLAAYLTRWLVQVAMAVGAMPILDAAREQFQRGDWVLASVVLSLGEQMQASTLMSAGPMLLLSLTEAAAGMVMGIRSVMPLSLVPWVWVCMALPRLLLDVQMRRLLRVSTRPHDAPLGKGAKASASMPILQDKAHVD